MTKPKIVIEIIVRGISKRKKIYIETKNGNLHFPFQSNAFLKKTSIRLN